MRQSRAIEPKRLEAYLIILIVLLEAYLIILVVLLVGLVFLRCHRRRFVIFQKRTNLFAPDGSDRVSDSNQVISPLFFHLLASVDRF